MIRRFFVHRAERRLQPAQSSDYREGHVAKLLGCATALNWSIYHRKWGADPSQGKGQKWELVADKVEIVGSADDSYPLQKKGHTPEFLREIAHLRPRSNLFSSVFRVRSRLAFAVHQFFQDRGFVYVHTPIITGSDCEGAGELFRVTTLNPQEMPRTAKGEIDYAKDFFARPTFLTVSGQLEAEAFALALSNVYTFGPTFRAENSNTSRHASEFWMIEPEMAFCDLKGNMDLAEEFVKYLIRGRARTLSR